MINQINKIQINKFFIIENSEIYTIIIYCNPESMENIFLCTFNDDITECDSFLGEVTEYLYNWGIFSKTLNWNIFVNKICLGAKHYLSDTPSRQGIRLTLIGQKFRDDWEYEIPCSGVK